MRVYAWVAAGSVVLPHATTLKPVPALWPPVPEGSGGTVLNALLAFFVAGLGVVNCISYSDFLSLHLVATISSGGLYGALAAWLQASSGESELRAIMRAHGELNALATELDDVSAPFLPMYLLPPLGGTALATCGFLFGSFTTNYLSLVPQIFIVFMPICLYADVLWTSSGPDMCWAAHCSGWMEWQTAPRRTLGVLMARTSRPQALTVKAFGPADREACLSVLKTWFSFLQALTNLSH
ncbi:hypothetical protein ONE63_009532 [Megalurothrips usitatus]|uniref:Uncharacterized protein n=1 Tax=Megalurothrips usitatus TaxID=439358 RepID=A0AAV7XP10_9NEOP|nr:hypothetical protein ONE63_009532 [Megalurothrips usitatus]